MNSPFWGTIRLINGWLINSDKSVWRTVDNLKAKLTCHFLAVEIVRTTMDLFVSILHRDHPVTIFTKTSKYSTHDGLLRLIPKIWIDYILTVWRPFCVIRKISCQINNVIGKKKESIVTQASVIPSCTARGLNASSNVIRGRAIIISKWYQAYSLKGSVKMTIGKYDCWVHSTLRSVHCAV